MAKFRMRMARNPKGRWILPNTARRHIQEALDAAQLPVRRKRGRPFVEAGPPLAPGHTTSCEFYDVDVTAPITTAAFARRLDPTLPPGFEIRWIRRLRPRARSLQAAASAFCYTVQCCVDAGRAVQFHQAATWPLARSKRGRQNTIDLKNNVSRIAVRPACVDFCIEVHAEGVPKPEEAVASIFGLEWAEAMLLPIERTAIFFIPDQTPDARLLEFA